MESVPGTLAASRPELLEISDLVVDFDLETMSRRPVKGSSTGITMVAKPSLRVITLAFASPTSVWTVHPRAMSRHWVVLSGMGTSTLALPFLSVTIAGNQYPAPATSCRAR